MPTFAEDIAEAQRLQRAGDSAGAATRFESALRAAPAQADLLVQLGIALRSVQREETARTAFLRAIEVDASCAEAHHQLGNALKRLGRLAEAIPPLETAARLAPKNAAVWLNLGVALLETDRAEAAAAAFEKAVALGPTRAEAHNIFGVALTRCGRHAEARAALESALRLRPDYADAHNNLARIWKAEGRTSEAIAEYRKALSTAPQPTTHSNLLLALNFEPALPASAVYAEHRAWERAYVKAESTPPPGQWPAARRLRIGYVSPDFNHHAVAYFILPVLRAHDRRRVEVFCYSNVQREDRFTEKIRNAAEHWRDIARVSDDEAAALVRRDGIDLLFDLAGHTAHHRLLLFARRPAPVQATWIGYPNTTGLSAINYRITDAIADPVGQTDALHSEKLVRLPHTFSCYGPDERAPDVAPLPCRAAGHVTFGCFNAFAKISEPVIACWSRILGAVPGSRLLLKSRGLGDTSVTARIAAAFGSHGIAADRLDYDGRELTVPEHLGLYARVDVALDPFPYNGTTTTCEALWMGVPVVTLAGTVHAARVGATLLTHVGLPDWVTADPDSYVARAIWAAQEVDALADLRARLREQMRLSPLCDAASFTRAFEEACEKMAARKV